MPACRRSCPAVVVCLTDWVMYACTCLCLCLQHALVDAATAARIVTALGCVPARIVEEAILAVSRSGHRVPPPTPPPRQAAAPQANGVGVHPADGAAEAAAAAATEPSVAHRDGAAGDAARPVAVAGATVLSTAGISPPVPDALSSPLPQPPSFATGGTGIPSPDALGPPVPVGGSTLVHGASEAGDALAPPFESFVDMGLDDGMQQ